VRSFPRTARGRLIAATSVAALALGTVTPLAVPTALAAISADDLKDKQKRVDKKVEKAKGDVHESSRRLAKAQARLSAAQSRLDSARAALATARGRVAVAAERDAQMQAELQEAEARLEQARQELEAGRQAMKEQEQEVVDTITGFYQQGDPKLLTFSALLRSESPADLTRQSELRSSIVGRETSAFDELHATEVLLEVRRREVSAIRDQVAEQRAAAAENLADKEEAESAAETARQQVATLVGDRRSARQSANRAKAADERTLRRLEAESRRVSEMLKRRAAAALRRQQAQQAAPVQRGGFLSWPTPGPVTSPFGYRKHPIYGYWGMHDGVDFAPGCGVALRASAPGTVVSSYWSDVYGRRLIIDHGAVAGKGLASVYNHASSYTVGVGERVERGETIGYVGSSGWSTGCHLHFTVMANGKAVAPFNWM